MRAHERVRAETDTDPAEAARATPVPRGPSTTADDLGALRLSGVERLQRAAGNRAVDGLLGAARERSAPARATASPLPLQRTITVRNIDYDPDAQEFTDGTVADEFFGALRTKLTEDAVLKKLTGKHAADVLRGLKDNDYEGGDLDHLTRVITQAIQEAYRKSGDTAWSPTLTARLGELVKEALAANLARTGRRLDKEELPAFEHLVTVVGKPAMSMAKGQPTEIAVGQLRADLQAEVRKVHAEITAEHARWTVASFDVRFLAEEVLTQDVSRHLDHYRGNHTNNAGWLPPQPLPVNPLHALRATVQAGTALPAALAAIGDAQVKRMAWSSLASGVSAYIEFWLGHAISRLVYDFVDRRYYLTAHYKWHGGYNPFFHLTGL